MSSKLTPNAIFKNGDLWLPVVNDITSEVKLPLMYKGAFGSIMPFVHMRIPGIFDSKVIPYENIVSFSHIVAVNKAELSFLDQTPIFAEELFRQVMAAIRSPSESRSIIIKYGWRIQNPSEEIEPLLDSDGLFSSPEYHYAITSLNYQYVDTGVLVTLTLNGSSLNDLDNHRITKLVLNSTDFNGTKEGFVSFVTNMLNLNIKRTAYPYQAVVYGNIRFDNLTMDKVQIESSLTASEMLDKITAALYVPPGEKRDVAKESSGEVLWYSPETPIVVTDANGVRKAVYPVYFWQRDALPEAMVNVPVIQYPSNISPIISFSPSFTAAQGQQFISDSRFKFIDADGNEKSQTVDQRALIAGVPTAGFDGEIMRETDGLPNYARQGAGKSSPFYVKIDLDILGDPLLSTQDSLFTKVRVDNANIIQEGLVRDTRDFFSNFPGLSEDIRRKLPVLSGVPANVSPYNGTYIIQHIQHDISIGTGYKTSILLNWTDQ